MECLSHIDTNVYDLSPPHMDALLLHETVQTGRPVYGSQVLPTNPETPPNHSTPAEHFPSELPGSESADRTNRRKRRHGGRQRQRRGADRWRPRRELHVAFVGGEALDDECFAGRVK